MKLHGFIGPAYTLDSVNVDCQRCVNLYLEVIESGTGKGGQVAYLKATPGLNKILDVGDGPIRLVHTDSIGRIFVVSGDDLYRVGKRADMLYKIHHSQPSGVVINQSTEINVSTDVLTYTGHNFYTGMKFRLDSTVSMPGGLAVLTDYYAIVLTANTFKIATSLSNALAGTAVNITSNGTGFMDVDPVYPDPLYRVSVNDEINYTTDRITRTGHGFWTGLRIQMSANWPGGTISNVYVIRVDANSFQIATSVANANAGTAYDLSQPDDEWYAQLCTTGGEFEGGASTFDTSSGPVKAASMSFAGDGTDSSTLFVDGKKNMLYLGDGENDFFGPLSSYGYGTVDTATDIQWIDGYFIVNESGTNKFWVSDLGLFNIDALSFASSEGDPDILLALMANHRDLWLFNEKTTEIYSNTGNADFPFERISGGFLEIGTAAKASVAKIDGTIFWLGRSSQGQGIVYSAAGMAPKRVSTHAIEQAIAGYADISTATGYTYQSGGHSFYVLNFDEATWVYDLSTGLWHERAYTNDGHLERHRGDTHAFSLRHNVHVVGDFERNDLYLFDDAYYFDGEAAITRLRSSPHISADLNWLFCSKFQLDMETGVGLVSGVGSDPQVMLDWSNDGGHTWSDESWTSAGGQVGGIGEYKTRVIWRRLGKFRDRVFRVKITDPVKVRLIEAHIEITAGAS